MPAQRSSSSQKAQDDAVALDELAGPGPGSSGDEKRGRRPPTAGRLASFKVLVAVFVIFVLVVSDVFTNGIVSGFKGAVRCRTPTSFGVVVQGVFVVIFYVLALHLIEGDII